MAKKYDMVETSKMSAEYDGSLIIGDCVAQVDMENGRFAVVDEVDKTTTYATKSTDEVVLVASVEKLYNDEGLTEFRNPKGSRPRLIKFRKGDTFITTAIDSSMFDTSTGKLTGLQKKDKVVVGAEGRLLKTSDVQGAKFVAEVKDVTVLYFDRTPAIKVIVQ